MDPDSSDPLVLTGILPSKASALYEAEERIARGERKAGCIAPDGGKPLVIFGMAGGGSLYVLQILPFLFTGQLNPQEIRKETRKAISTQNYKDLVHIPLHVH